MNEGSEPNFTPIPLLLGHDMKLVLIFSVTDLIFMEYSKVYVAIKNSENAIS